MKLPPRIDTRKRYSPPKLESFGLRPGCYSFPVTIRGIKQKSIPTRLSRESRRAWENYIETLSLFGEFYRDLGGPTAAGDPPVFSDELIGRLVQYKGRGSSDRASNPIERFLLMDALAQLNREISGCIERARKAAGTAWPDVDSLSREIERQLPLFVSRYGNLVRNAVESGLGKDSWRNDNHLRKNIMVSFFVAYQRFRNPQDKRKTKTLEEYVRRDFRRILSEEW